MRRVTAETKQRILEALRAGCTIAEICRLYQVHYRTVAPIAFEHNIVRKSGRPAPRLYEDLPRIPMYVPACGQIWRV